MEIKLTLVTKRNPKNIKGFDSTVGAIVDADNNLVCVVPLTRMDWVFDCLTAKTRTDHLFTVLSRMTDDQIHLCSACRRNVADDGEEEMRSNRGVVRFDSPRRKASKAVPM